MINNQQKKKTLSTIIEPHGKKSPTNMVKYHHSPISGTRTSAVTSTSTTVAPIKSDNVLPSRKILIKRSESRRSFKSDNVRCSRKILILCSTSRPKVRIYKECNLSRTRAYWRAHLHARRHGAKMPRLNATGHFSPGLSGLTAAYGPPFPRIVRVNCSHSSTY
jgi:hypothetical protein